MAKTPSYASAGASQCIVAGYNPTGASGFVPWLCSIPLAMYVELRVQSRLMNGTDGPNADIAALRAEELQATVLPGNI